MNGSTGQTGKHFYGGFFKYVDGVSSRILGIYLNGQTFWYDLSDGSKLTQGSFPSTVEAFPNGWFRIMIERSADTTFYCWGADEDGDITPSLNNKIYFWGTEIQHTSSAVLTSHIPTSGSATTRTRGILSDSGSTSIISSTAGVLYLEIQALGSSGRYRFFNITEATSNQSDRITLGIMNNEKAVAHIQRGTQQFSQQVTTDFNSDYVKMAFLYKAGDNNCEFFINGSDVSTSHTGVTLPTSLANLNSSDFNASFEFEGRIKTVAYFTNELTPAQLATLTS